MALLWLVSKRVQTIHSVIHFNVFREIWIHNSLKIRILIFGE